MKVYALREMVTDYGYMPVRGYHSSLVAAKKQAKELFNRAKWDIALYEATPKFTKDEIISLLNEDSISSFIDGRVPRDFIAFNKIVFESAALKRYRKEK